MTKEQFETHIAQFREKRQQVIAQAEIQVQQLDGAIAAAELFIKQMSEAASQTQDEQAPQDE